MRWLQLATFALLISLAAVALPNDRAEAMPEAVPVGQQYLGVPYGAWGLDCSGFTSAVYADLGVYLPDDPAAQYSYGYPVAYPAPGDLVFFDEAGYGISHVGIYTGNGMVLHASTYYGAVVESPMQYVPGYVGAVHI